MRSKRFFGLIVMFGIMTLLSGCSAGEAAVLDTSYSSTGIVECKEVDIRAKIPGKIINIYVKEGQEVKAGTLLFTTDDRDLKVKKLQAAASVKAAKAKLDKAENGATDETIRSAKALADKAQLNVDLLQKEYDKMLIMYDTGGLSEDNLDKLTTQLEAAKLDAYMAGEQYNTALNGARSEDIEALEAQYEAAKAVLAEVDLNLDATKVVAPTDGIVTMLSSEVGELIASGTPVVTITDYSERWVLVNVDELHIGKLAAGQNLLLTAKAYPDQKFTGTILNVSKTPDFATKKSTNELNDQDIVTYEVKIAIPLDDNLLYPGMLTNVILEPVVSEAEVQ
ncbi:MAG: HlyD family efflux transporter periplasmic adaptor subunit [Clostridia bacterium]|nr:HlyD family efflux transporter periplasmic adaptor subunit [Clostridia bacterium]